MNYPCPFPGRIKLRSQLSLAESESRRRGGRTTQQVGKKQNNPQKMSQRILWKMLL